VHLRFCPDEETRVFPSEQRKGGAVARRARVTAAALRLHDVVHRARKPGIRHGQQLDGRFTRKLVGCRRARRSRGCVGLFRGRVEHRSREQKRQRNQPRCPTEQSRGDALALGFQLRGAWLHARLRECVGSGGQYSAFLATLPAPDGRLLRNRLDF